MAKYIKKGGERVQFSGEDIRVDSKNRMYVEFKKDTTVQGFGVIPKGKKTYLENVNGSIQIQNKGN